MSNQNGFDEVSRACVPLHVCLVCVCARSLAAFLPENRSFV